MKFLPRQLAAGLLLTGLSWLPSLTAPAHAGTWSAPPTYEVGGRFPASDHNTTASCGGGGGETQGTGENGTPFPGGPTVQGSSQGTFLYSGDNAADVPPPQMYVLETATAGWEPPQVEEGGGGGHHPHAARKPQAKATPSASFSRNASRRAPVCQAYIADDGLGHAAVATPTGGMVSKGYKLTLCAVVALGNNTYKIVAPQRTLHASGPAGPAPDPVCLASWSYTARVLTAEIQRDGVDITDPKTSDLKDVNVGEPIALAATIAPLPQDVPVTGKTWSIEGTTVKSYIQSNPQAKKIDLTDDDLKDKGSIKFYWFKGNGDGAAPPTKVKFNVTVAGTAIELTATFTVNIPVSSFSGKYTDKIPPVDAAHDPIIGGQEHNYLGLGDFLNEGIKFEGHTTTSAKGAGDIAIVQLLTEATTYTRNDTSTTVLSSQGKFVLDDGNNPSHIQYPAKPAIFGYVPTVPSSQPIKTDNSPNDPLTNDYTYVVSSNSFQTYLMYKAADKYQNDPNIWVPLRVFSWQFAGKAKKTTATYDDSPSKKWVLDGPGTPYRGDGDPTLAVITGDPTTEPPQWDNSHSGLHFVG